MPSHDASLPAGTLATREAADPRDEMRAAARVVAANLLLGTIGLFLLQAAQPPAVAAWWRCVFGGLSLTAWLAATGRLGCLRLRGRALAAALGGGALMVGSWTLFFAAIEHLSIGVATVVFNIQPFWLMAIGAAWLGERVTRRQWLAAGVALAGLALASGVASGLAANLPAGADRSAAIAGLGICLVGSLSYALAALVGRAASRVSPLAPVWWQCVAGAVALAPWALADGLPQPPSTWGWLAALGVLHTGVAYVLLFGGMARLGAGRVAVLQFVYPAAAIAVDWLVVGHRMDMLQLVGAGLIVAALFAGRRGTAC